MGDFTKFDYGKEENFKKYKQDEPPIYNLDNIRNKTIAFVSCKHDTVVDYQNVKQLEKDLKNVKLFDNYVVPNDDWNHVDFHLGPDVGRYVNHKLIEILQKAEKFEG